VTRHGTEEEFELYLRGGLSRVEVTELEEHMMACPDCVDQLEETRQFTGAMREALRGDLETRSTEERSAASILASVFRFRFAMAAVAVLLIAGIVGGIVYTRGGGRLAPMATLELTAMRGEMVEVARAQGLYLKLTDAPAGAFRVQVVDAVGRPEWDGNVSGGEAGVGIRLDKELPEGPHFVRLYSAQGTMLHEYGFRVR
jgi:hypothetical protein